ncbi:diaminopimelate decarboxylase [Candidatus Magnetominusculus xianensis]|uniref:Diaminopimelate decarboxylase n=1 Tax=Candidatus Magnetominusculus xianensis TaxID=1748249 RepID=A0ABR5SKN6_9BACT|nr:diaminopimelate decarboxylase [Candidatus Magnetominusculus xianensis]MBF0403349.1 diaminopimelate decarboxylase [Nitrospirota bacterium]
MHYFDYKNSVFHAEDVSMETLVEAYGTPLYVYSYKTLLRHFKSYDDSFKDFPHIICYALKANSNAAILRTFASEGGGADIVSGGELFRALRAGIPPEKIVYAGVGKKEDEIIYALRENILMFNVESEQELMAIDKAAAKLGKSAPIALRINPDVDPATHAKITTGHKKNKFGIPIEGALEFYKIAHKLKHVKIVGIHEHIGSQIISLKPFLVALQRLVSLIDELKAEGIEIKYLDIGGGLGIQYLDEIPPHPSELAEKIKPILQGRNLTIVMEPGRTLVGNAGLLVTKVLYTKKGHDRDFIIVDAGMNDMIRPAMYDAYHHIMPVHKKKRKDVFADIVGPICESGDFLGKDRELPSMLQGEYAVVMSAGAYGFSMSSNYNSRPRTAEVLVNGSEHYLIRKRQTYEDLVRDELIPEFIK